MIAYFDCFSGISGDMTLGAFIDLGVPVPWLKENLAALPLAGFDLAAADVKYNGIHAKRVEVAAHGHAHRNYAAIRTLIEKSHLAESVKATALAIFKKLAHAEAGIHDCLPEEVHFHEIGGVDAIVDVVGAALCADYLRITRCVASPIPTGSGFVDCRHGRLPVPAPATVAILKGVPVAGSEVAFELTTPTGAAIVVSLAQQFGPMPAMTLRGIGYGAGSRNLDPGPNLLRIMLGDPAASDRSAPAGLLQDRIVVAETTIDDMNPELFGYAMEKLFSAGALDVVWIPIHMKKNRPGTLLQVLCRHDLLEAIVDCILTETTSLGVRYFEAGRYMLPRSAETLETSFGKVVVKQVCSPQGEIRRVPEYEECRRIALEKHLPIRVVYDRIAGEANSGK